MFSAKEYRRSMPSMPSMPKMPKMPKIPKMSTKTPSSRGGPRPDVGTRPKKIDKPSSGGKDLGKNSKKVKSPADKAKKARNVMGAAVAVAGVAGIGGILANEKYKDLKKEEKKCLAVCAPDDWDQYVAGTITRPTYKTKDIALYADLYETDGTNDNLCTEANMTKQGVPIDTDGCETFCENICDFDTMDVVKDTGGDIGDGIWDNTIGPVLDPVWDNFKNIFTNPLFTYGSILVACILLYFVIIRFL